MIIFGIETSCDETSIALVEDGTRILATPVLSQIDLHKEYFGVVPEIASRAHLENINLLTDQALKEAKLSFTDIDAFAVTNRPGLIGALMIGVATAKAYSYACQKPLIGVNHLIGHLYSAFFNARKPSFPFIGVIVSGGHTLLVRVDSWDDILIKGTTIDDAVGEAFDKVAKIMKLEYPGGPIIDKLAEKGDPDSIPLPAIHMYGKKRNNFNFTYSGLKTAVLYRMAEYPETKTEDLCASFRKAAIDVLYQKTVRLCHAEQINRVVVAGGVSANSYLRKIFLADKNLNVFLPEPNLTADNAAMIAGCAFHRFQQKKFDFLNMNVYAKNDLKYDTGVLS